MTQKSKEFLSNPIKSMPMICAANKKCFDSSFSRKKKNGRRAEAKQKGL